MTGHRTTRGWSCAALLLVACTDSCGRGRPEPARLDYAPFLKAGGDVIAAAFADLLEVAPVTRLEPGQGPAADAGDDRAVYAAAAGGRIEVHFDGGRRPLWVQYYGPANCLSPSGGGERRIAPAEANASVLARLRRLGLPVDDHPIEVESRLHDDGLVWIGVYVWQTHRGEVIERPSVFAIVDGITNRVCEIRVPRWYLGLDSLPPPLSRETLTARAQAAAGVHGPPTLRSLRIVADTLCREVKPPDPSEPLCLDVVTGRPVGAP